MTAETINVDGREYKVAIVYPSRELTYEIAQGKNAGTSLADREIADIRGTYYSYALQAEPLPGFQSDFDALFKALSAPVAYHRFVMPFAQETMEFDAKSSAGRIVDKGMTGNERKWGGMTISITPIEPQRRPEE